MQIILSRGVWTKRSPEIGAVAISSRRLFLFSLVPDGKKKKGKLFPDCARSCTV